VHHVAGPADWPEAQERIAGWRDALTAAGAEIPAVHPESWNAETGYAQGQALARDQAVTAIFCANDRIALGVLRALHEAGRKVPEEVSVVGFDDMPESGYFLPPLTTVRQDFAELGRLSLALLLEHMAGPESPAHVVVAPELAIRASTARPARARVRT
jgi:DNA-binding LacI/PurR family transcriptional regulator